MLANMDSKKLIDHRAFRAREFAEFRRQQAHRAKVAAALKAGYSPKLAQLIAAHDTDSK